MNKKSDPNSKLIADNRRARYDYAVEDTLEAGIMLLGSEVKSLREGKANIAEAYVSPENGEMWLINANIPEYRQAGRFNHEERRPRKLLVSRRERAKLAQGVEREGMTIAPLRLYFNDRGIAKLLIGLAKGKKLHDKRATERERDWNREKRRVMKDFG